MLALLIGADDRSYRMTGSDVCTAEQCWSTEWVIMIVNELRIIVRVRIQFAVCYGPDPVARTCPTDITCAWYQGCLRPCIQVSWSPVLRAVHTACDFVVDKIGVCVCVCGNGALAVLRILKGSHGQCDLQVHFGIILLISFRFSYRFHWLSPCWVLKKSCFAFIAFLLCYPGGWL